MGLRVDNAPDLCIRKVLNSNLGKGLVYPDYGCSWLCSVPPGKCRGGTASFKISIHLSSIHSTLYNLPTESSVKYPKIIFSGLLWHSSSLSSSDRVTKYATMANSAWSGLSDITAQVKAFACLKISAYFPTSLPHDYGSHAITQGQFKPH